MSANSPEMLLGRLAVHYKMLTLDQLNELTQLQARSGGSKKLGELMVDARLISPAQLEQLIKVQRDYIAKQQARAAADRARAAPVGDAARAVAAASQQRAHASQDAGATQSPTPISTQTRSTPLGAIETKRVEKDVSAPRPANSASSPARPTASPATPTASTSSGARRVDSFLREAVAAGASDIHFHCGSPVRRRVNGALSDASAEPLPDETTRAMVDELLNAGEREALVERGQIDFAYAIDGVARFRCNAYRQATGVDLVMRAISADPPSLEQLGLPGSLAKFTNYHQGMVLLTGPAGSGKSSTMAALINIINEERLDHIITVEDPIEFVHVNKRCVVNQRQVGPHTKSFARALKGALREDPDIIALGELRDLETISLALTAAETGHLVLATLHTGNAIRTVNRLIGVFPPNQQAQIRTMVSESLRAVVSQRLVPRADGQGRVPALEILVTTKAVGNTIRDNKTFQLRSALQTGVSHGMKLLDVSLAQLVKDGVVNREDAIKQADDPQKFPA